MSAERQPSAGPGPVRVDEPAAGVVRIRLDRPARRNAVDETMLEALRDAFVPAGDARALVVASAVPGTFCAGADVSVPDDERARVSVGLYALYAQIAALPVPVVAALGGPAVGGGAQLAIACDLRVAAPAAWLRFVGPGHGLAVGAWALPGLVGRGRALDLCLTGRRVEAHEALGMGLVDRVEEDADAAAMELARSIAALDPAAVARVKEIVGHAGERADALALEAEGNRSWRGGMSRPPG